MARETASTVVILEDEALVALDLEDQLRDEGFKVMGLFSSCASALEWFGTNTPDVVLMDIELRDGDCTRIARMLHHRRIPFVVHSASMASSSFHDPIFLQGTWLTKPCLASDLSDAVRTSLEMVRDVSRPAKARRAH